MRTRRRLRLLPSMHTVGWAAVFSILLLSNASEGSRRDLRQVTDLEEAERLADAFLDEFLAELGLDVDGSPLPPAASPEPANATAGGSEDDDAAATSAPTPAPTPAPTTPAPTAPARRVVEVREVYPEGDPWNPVCNASDVRLPVVRLGGKAFHGADKEKVSMFVPPHYEIKAWAVVRSRHWSGIRPGIGAVKSKGLNFIAEVSKETNPNRTICGDWVYAEDGVYNWQVFADFNVYMDVYFTAREHLGNGAAAQLHGAFPQQRINLRASSSLFIGGSEVAATQKVDIDLQGRGADKDYTIDNRLRNDNITVSNTMLDGPQDYVLERGAQRWGGGTWARRVRPGGAVGRR